MVDLTRYQQLVVRQQVEPLEVFMGLETENRYSVIAPEGEAVLFAYEESGFLRRQFLRTHRPLTLHVMDYQRQPVLKASRGFFWFFSHLHVSDGTGGPLGSLRRRFAVLERRFILEDHSGHASGEVRGPLFRPNTFVVHDQGTEIARITKRWSGLLKEGFSKADTFDIEFVGPGRGQDFALLVLATAFAIDLDFFEGGGGRVRFSSSVGSR